MPFRNRFEDHHTGSETCHVPSSICSLCSETRHSVQERGVHQAVAVHIYEVLEAFVNCFHIFLAYASFAERAYALLVR